jgi:hypothetical protein
MDTTIHSDKKVGPRSRWLALGVDTAGQWHNLRVRRDAPDEIVVTDERGIVWRECLEATTAEAWVQHIDDERGWIEHPDADPRRTWLEGATA